MASVVDLDLDKLQKDPLNLKEWHASQNNSNFDKMTIINQDLKTLKYLIRQKFRQTKIRSNLFLDIYTSKKVRTKSEKLTQDQMSDEIILSGQNCYQTKFCTKVSEYSVRNKVTTSYQKRERSLASCCHIRHKHYVIITKIASEQINQRCKWWMC